MKSKKNKPIESILVISLSCIGDVLLTTPVIGVLKDNFPSAQITVLAGKTSYPLLERHELVARALIFDNRGAHRGSLGVVRLITELRRSRYDLVVDLRNTMIPYALRVRRRITAHSTHLRQRKLRGRHAIDRHLDVLADHGITVTRRDMILSVPEDVSAKVDSLLTDAGLTSNNELIAIYPGAGSKYKEYPAEKLSTVVRALAACGNRKFAVIGSEADAESAAQVTAAVPEAAVNFAGKIDLLEVAALLKRCSLLISNDSGPMHIGAAVGTPVLALFGPTDADRYRPRGEQHVVIAIRKECNPCKTPICEMDSCIGEIAPEIIIEEAEKMLSKNF
ncbi:MAG: lipopolysaccharide heptosyltransferase II [bacterium]